MEAFEIYVAGNKIGETAHPDIKVGSLVRVRKLDGQISSVTGINVNILANANTTATSYQLENLDEEYLGSELELVPGA